MRILETLATKPWLHSSVSALIDESPERTASLNAARIALRLVLAVVGVLFFLFIITFLSRSQYPDFEALAGAPWQPFTDSSRLWLNSAILLCASICLQGGLGASRIGKLNAVVGCISAAIFFTVLFILAQYDLWLYLQSMGFYLNSNPANSYFYLLTGIHGIHLLGGLVGLSFVIFRWWNENSADNLSDALQLCATYWHFLFLVWMVLFGLLTSTPETINALAAMCGF